MKKILALVTLTTIFATSYGQIASNSTPEIGEVYSFAWSSSGNAYSLTDIPVYQVHMNLPFGLDFDAGHGAVYGQRMDGTEFVGNVFGYQVFGQKNIGGDGAFLRAALSVLIGDKRPDYCISAGLGFRF